MIADEIEPIVINHLSDKTSNHYVVWNSVTGHYWLMRVSDVGDFAPDMDSTLIVAGTDKGDGLVDVGRWTCPGGNVETIADTQDLAAAVTWAKANITMTPYPSWVVWTDELNLYQKGFSSTDPTNDPPGGPTTWNGNLLMKGEYVIHNTQTKPAFYSGGIQYRGNPKNMFDVVYADSYYRPTTPPKDNLWEAMLAANEHNGSYETVSIYQNPTGASKKKRVRAYITQKFNEIAGLWELEAWVVDRDANYNTLKSKWEIPQGEKRLIATNLYQFTHVSATSVTVGSLMVTYSTYDVNGVQVSRMLVIRYK
jgi:hypothetical protein